MNKAERIAIIHASDPIGAAIVKRLQEASIPYVELADSAASDEIVEAGFGSRAVIAVGDSLATSPAILAAAGMPGVEALVVVVSGSLDLSPVRRRGVPYTVLRAGHAPDVDYVARRAIAAVDAEDECGGVVDLSPPSEPVPPLTVESRWSAWIRSPWRAFARLKRRNDHAMGMQ